MIKQIENPNPTGQPELLICDNCGEGLGLSDNPDEKLKEYIKDFKQVHKDCEKPKHDLSDIITEE